MNGKKLPAFLLSLVLLLALSLPAAALGTPSVTIGGLDNNLWTTKYGNLFCSCTVEEFLEMGYTWGDIVTVKIRDKELNLPVVPTYSYVDTGVPAIIADQNDPSRRISFAINMGNFTETYGIAVKQTDESGNWWWTAMEGVDFPLEVTFQMEQQGGYLSEYLLRDLTRTNLREDYTHLTDEAFANFRPVTTSGMGENFLYRSSSPINPELGRNEYAAAAVEQAGIKTIVNLADSAEDSAAYPGFADTYYAGQQVVYLSLGVDFQAADFQAGLAEGLRFIAANKGPYLIHCTEGKDRAGFTSALLECFMGAGYDEVIADYMTTYYNYYGVEPDSEKYAVIAKSNIIKSLEQAFHVGELVSADLRAEAVEYVKGLGLTGAEIDALYANLSTCSAEEDSKNTYTVIAGDCLWSIAAKTMGSGVKWSAIYEANKAVIKNPRLIYAGQVLTIPAA